MSTLTVFSDGTEMEEIVRRTVDKDCREVWEEPFYMVNLGNVVYLYNIWKEAMPSVTPFYAVKCNSDVLLLKTLAVLGAGFDCATKREMELVLSIGVPAEKIIYANPCKYCSHMQYAAQVGVDVHSFDCEGELHKTKKYFPHSKLVLRIRCDDPKALLKMGCKFGVDISESLQLLTLARNLELNVIGVCFHVGSHCKNPAVYSKAIEMAAKVFQYGQELSFQFTLLDIGGGFPGRVALLHGLFLEMARAINEALEKHFSGYPHVKVIAEPGTYFASSPFSLAASVIGKKVFSDPVKYMYTISEGAFGAFILSMKKDPPLQFKDEHSSRTFPSTLWGPTCSVLDHIADLQLPELFEGDWVLVRHMGDYCEACATTFNGFQRPTKHFYHAMDSKMKELKSVLSELKCSVVTNDEQTVVLSNPNKPKDYQVVELWQPLSEYTT